MSREMREMPEMRNLVVIGQNETGRSSTEKANVYLSTVGLLGCVAVIFYSKKTGRISLTHADTQTDLEFLFQEFSWVGENCKVFLIVNQGHLGEVISLALQRLGVSKVTIHTTSEGTVVFNHKKKEWEGEVQEFLHSDFLELISSKKESNPANRLRQLNYQPSNKQDAFIAQKNTYIRQLNAAVSLICSHYPILAFDESGWRKFELELASDVLSNISDGIIRSRVSFEYVWPRYKILISQMELAAARGVELTPIFAPSVPSKGV